jgi:hypothetical protein
LYLLLRGRISIIFAEQNGRTKKFLMRRKKTNRNFEKNQTPLTMRHIQ